jgi:mannose-6-phosphate isomerase-like protein (cupin superfamily)
MFAKQIEDGLDLMGVATSISAIFDTWLEPGQEIWPHYHPDFEEIYYILSGYGVMTIGDEHKEIARGDVVYIPPLAMHTLLNTSDRPLRFVTVTVNVSSQEKPYDAQTYI